jgi:hypothetical protein
MNSALDCIRTRRRTLQMPKSGSERTIGDNWIQMSRFQDGPLRGTNTRKRELSTGAFQLAQDGTLWEHIGASRFRSASGSAGSAARTAR